MVNKLTEREIAQFFGLNHLLQRLEFVNDAGEKIQAAPYLSWYMWTNYYGTSRHDSDGIWKPISGTPFARTYIAIIHTRIGSKALLYYKEIS